MKNSKQAPMQKGPGTSYKPTSSPAIQSAKIPSKTLATSPNSHKRGKQG